MFAGERKALLRRNERGRFGSDGPGRDLAGTSLAVQEQFLAAFPPVPGGRIALYAAVRGEVGTDRIRERCLAAGVSLYYPRMCDDGSLAFFRHGKNDGWAKGRFGIPEPRGARGAEGIREGFDLVIVPGLAFDAAGRRLGQGHGYYDRFLVGLGDTAMSVGLAFSWQVVPEVPVDAWDVPVDVVVTENGVVARNVK